MPSLKEWLFGKEEKFKKVPTMTVGQTGIQSQLEQMLGGGMGGQGGGLAQLFQTLLGNLNPQNPQQEFEGFEQPYLNEFEEQTLPGIAERFAGAGALSSSGFGQALGGARAGLAANLAGLKSGLQQQSKQMGMQTQQNALQQLMQLIGSTQGAQPFAYQQKSASTGAVAPALAAFMNGLGKAVGAGGG